MPLNRTSDVAVWRATEADASAVATLLVEFRDWAGSAAPDANGIRASVELLLRDPGAVFLLAAVDTGLPAAAVCQIRYRHSVWTSCEDCWLEDLYVSAPARRAGLGRALLRAACEDARRRGARRIELDANDENLAALSLYESHGFSARSKQMGSLNSRDLLMGLRL